MPCRRLTKYWSLCDSFARWKFPASYRQYCWFESSQRAAGKIYMSYSPSQDRVRYFSSQKGATSIFARKNVFALPIKERVKKKKSPWSAAHGGRREKISQEKQNNFFWVNVYDIYLSHYLIREFMFPTRKVSSELIFRRTAVVDCSPWLPKSTVSRKLARKGGFLGWLVVWMEATSVFRHQMRMRTIL